MAIKSGNMRRPLNYPTSLDVVAITVGNTEITLRDMAFYVAYEEMEVEKQAIVYDPEDTNKYWNIHTDGEFVKVAAKNAAIQMAIHDQIFCQMAEADGVTLEASDYEYIRNSESDFISDLEDYEGLEKLGVTEEDICNSMERVALAQKYQQMYAEMNGENMEAYDFTGDAYKELVENLGDLTPKALEDKLYIIAGRIARQSRKTQKQTKTKVNIATPTVKEENLPNIQFAKFLLK